MAICALLFWAIMVVFSVYFGMHGLVWLTLV